MQINIVLFDPMIILKSLALRDGIHMMMNNIVDSSSTTNHKPDSLFRLV